MATRSTRSAAPQLTIDLDAIASNVRTMSRIVPGELMAVVKADGFGHGAATVARTALGNGATSLGVATIDEALALRREGFTAPILSWLNPVDADFEAAVRSGVDVTAPSLQHLASIASAARRAGRAARVHVQVDTGMARDGAARTEWFALSAASRTAELRGQVRVVGVMGHLPCAEMPGHPSTAAGRRQFLDAVDVVRGAGLRPTTLHLAATAAALGAPETHFDLCRIGAGLYGIGEGLRPALTLTAPIVMVREVAAGTRVGYGHTWVAERATRLALVPLGYGDGLPRVSGASAEVWVQGARRPLAGTISMDQLVVDVGDLPVVPGDTVTIFGPGDSGEPTVAEWSAWSQTVPHEIMTGLGARITRTHGGAR
jgi:alanine racemase